MNFVYVLDFKGKYSVHETPAGAITKARVKASCHRSTLLDMETGERLIFRDVKRRLLNGKPFVGRVDNEWEMLVYITRCKIQN